MRREQSTGNSPLDLAVALKSGLRAESGLLLVITTLLLFIAFGNDWLANLGNPAWLALMLLWLFGAVLVASLRVVHHAECLAARLGEPYGTLILTLSVTCIEVAMISALMLNADNNPTLGRDAMFAVVMIVLNGIVGLSLLMGALRYREQSYNLQFADPPCPRGRPPVPAARSTGRCASIAVAFGSSTTTRPPTPHPPRSRAAHR